MSPFAHVAHLIAQRVTIYVMNEFGFGAVRIECSRWFAEYMKWAQYDRALNVLFVPKGAKKVRGKVEGYKPYLLVLEGWGHPDTRASGDGTTSFTSFHPAHMSNFDQMIDEYIATKGVKVLVSVGRTTAQAAYLKPTVEVKYLERCAHTECSDASLHGGDEQARQRMAKECPDNVSAF